MHHLQNNLINKIKRIMESEDLTASELADELKWTQTFMSNLLRGKTKRVPLEAYMSIAERLNIDIAELFSQLDGKKKKYTDPLKMPRKEAIPGLNWQSYMEELFRVLEKKTIIERLQYLGLLISNNHERLEELTECKIKYLKKTSTKR